MLEDGRRKNNLSIAQRRVAAQNQRKKKRKNSVSGATRLEAAKTILRRTGVEVYNAEIDDPRFGGFIRVGVRKHTPEEVLKMAAEVLHREATRQSELRAQYGLPKRKK